MKTLEIDISAVPNGTCRYDASLIPALKCRASFIPSLTGRQRFRLSPAPPSSGLPETTRCADGVFIRAELFYEADL
jgi:hypothetical protein